jgi:uncharacterized delta-60 repeat protein
MHGNPPRSQRNRANKYLLVAVAGFAGGLRISRHEEPGASTVKTAWVAFGLALLAGCGGGGGDSSGGGGGGTAPPPPPGIGSAGGTVTGPSNAQVVIPAGALTTNTQVAVAQSGSGAPAVPTGVTSFGQIFAFTPHGTTFTTPATVTVPFDPALVPAGATPALYKTNAGRTAWELVPGATVSGATMTGQVSSFSNFLVASFPDFTVKTWKIFAYDDNATTSPQPLQGATQIGGKLDRHILVGGPLTFPPAGRTDPRAKVGVFSSQSGETFWTYAEAPRPADGEPFNTSDADLSQRYTFQKTEPNATLKFVVTYASVEALDAGGAEPNQTACPWLEGNETEAELEFKCGYLLTTAIDSFSLKARTLGAAKDFLSIGGDLQLHGHHGAWNYGATYQADNELALWDISDFTLDEHVSEDPSLRHTSLVLKAPITIEVPLDKVPLESKFNVSIDMGSLASNLVQGESEVVATMTDPLEAKGLSIEFSGLVQLPYVDDVAPAPVAESCPTAPLPDAGVIQFTQSNYSTPERLPGADVVVTRTAGSSGAVIAQLETADGTALAGSDYQSVKTLVHFGDGQGGERVVHVPLVLDDSAEPDETMNVTLTTFSGCVALGAQAAATVTILDDDRHVAPTAFTLGGTLSGLAGGSVVLNNRGEQLTLSANGSFTFPVPVPDGATYSIDIATQPSTPLQVCTVTHGSGKLAGANVTDVQVACSTPQPGGSLDAGFGQQGKMTDSGQVVTVTALQPDGKLLVLGGMRISRYEASGAIDAGFGSAGHVAIVADGNGLDEVHAIAVQPDGKILVAGETSLPTAFNFHWFLQRFNPDGSLDTGFGTGGKVSQDFGTFTDDADAILVQPDGKIVVAGIATLGSIGLPDQDFAVARYLGDGTLDDPFGVHGIATKNVGGRSDFVSAAALQVDGGIVVTGRVFTDGGSGGADFGIVRFNADGSSDLTFGGDGVVRYDFGKGGDVPDTFDGGDWDQPYDLLIQPDGKILIAGYTGISVNVLQPEAFLVRLTTAGLADPTFGTNGLATLAGLADARGVALATDGKIVIAGSVGNDFGIARLSSAGAPDTSFDTDGLMTLDFFGGFDRAEDVLIQTDGKIVVTGNARNGTGGGVGMVRILP